MKRILLTFTLGAAFCPAFALQLLANGDFESGVLTPWAQTIDLGGPENWSVTRNDKANGTFSATARGNKMLYQSVAPISARFIVSSRVTLKNSDATFNAYRWYYTDNTYTENYLQTPNSAWNTYSLLPGLNRSKTVAGLGIFGVNGGITFRTWIDDVSVIGVRSGGANLNPVPEPATLAAFGALIALVARRRKA